MTTIPSPNHSGRGGAGVIWLIVHTAEGSTTARSLANYLAQSGSQVSYHDVVDDAETIHCVDYDQESWSALGANPRSDQVCCTGFVRWSRAEWLAHGGMLDNLARWLAARSKARGIPLVYIGADGVSRRAKGVIGHWDYTRGARDGTHTDPGPNFPWDVVMSHAQQFAGTGPTPPEDTVTPQDIAAIAKAAADEVLNRMYTNTLDGKKYPMWAFMTDGHDETYRNAAAIQALRDRIEELAKQSQPAPGGQNPPA